MSVSGEVRQSGRVVFVTGASRGIGRGIAEYFLQRQDRVAVGYSSNRELAEELCRSYPNGFPVCVDIGSLASIERSIATITEYFSEDVSVLVNNAGIAQEKPFLNISESDWERMLKVNLQGPFHLIQQVVPAMMKAGWGRIVNVTSIGGQWGGMNQVHYAAAKAGLINLTQSTAKVFSAAGITCNAIAPGLVKTDMSAAELQTEAGREKLKNIPVGRLGTVEEMASTVYFLSSDEASYITGQTVNLNGGMFFG